MTVVSLRTLLAAILFFSALFVCFILSRHKDSLTPIAALQTYFAQLHSNVTQEDSVFKLIQHNYTNDLQWRTNGKNMADIFLTSNNSPMTALSNLTSSSKADHSYNPTNLTLSTTKGTEHHPSSSPLTTNMEAVAERFRQRKTRVKNFCRDRTQGRLEKTLRSWIYCAPNYNLLVCVTPKVGSSTWLSHLLHLRGLNPRSKNVHTKHWKKQIKPSVLLGISVLKQRLRSSVTVMTVRHPLSRLVSAFRDKFGDGRHLERAYNPPKYKLFWRPALRSLKKPERSGFHFTFVEFLQFVLYFRPSDRHWQPVSQICSPCGLSYQYIFRLETFNEDLAYLAVTLNITAVISLDEHRNKKGRNRTEEGTPGSLDLLTLDEDYLKYYLHLPPRLLANVLKRYTLDFNLFGYKIPPVLQNRIRNETLNTI